MTTEQEKQFKEDMKRLRGVDFIELGMMVEIDGNTGTIVGVNSSANLDVVFANRLKYGSKALNCHPFWKARYFNKDGICIAERLDG